MNVTHAFINMNHFPKDTVSLSHIKKSVHVFIHVLHTDYTGIIGTRWCPLLETRLHCRIPIKGCYSHSLHSTCMFLPNIIIVYIHAGH